MTRRSEQVELVLRLDRLLDQGMTEDQACAYLGISPAILNDALIDLGLKSRPAERHQTLDRKPLSLGRVASNASGEGRWTSCAYVPSRPHQVRPSQAEFEFVQIESCGEVEWMNCFGQIIGVGHAAAPVSDSANCAGVMSFRPLCLRW